MNTITIYIKKQNPLMPYFKENMNGSRAVRNTANFLIRNVYTALNKAPEERTANENSVLIKVGMCLREANARKEAAYQKKVAQGKNPKKLTLHRIPDEKHKTLLFTRTSFQQRFQPIPDASSMRGLKSGSINVLAHNLTASVKFAGEL